MASWMLCDGLHYLLKWFFAGDRPFWVEGGNVSQISHTCEAGYGFPSGHTCILVCAIASLYNYGGVHGVLEKVGIDCFREFLMFFMGLYWDYISV